MKIRAMAEREPGINKQLAATLAPRLHGMTWDEAREFIDIATAGELDTWQLDKLTDWAIELTQARPSKK